MMKARRANRIAVESKKDGGFVARFYKTHTKLAEVDSKDTGFQEDAKLNSTANRELFRVWIADHAEEYGIEYDPVDRRDKDLQVPRRYDSDEILRDTAVRLVQADLEEWLGKIRDNTGVALEWAGLEADEVVPMETYKGKAKDPRYKAGHWAWAQVPVTLTVRYQEEDYYATMTVLLVSGQIKKPKGIGSNGYHYTGLLTELQKDIEDLKKKKKEDTEGSEA